MKSGTLTCLAVCAMWGVFSSKNVIGNPLDDLKKQIRSDIDQVVETSTDEVNHNPIKDADPALKSRLDGELQPLGLPGAMGWVPPSPYLRYAHAAGDLANLEEFIKRHHFEYYRAKSPFDKQDILSSVAPSLTQIKATLDASPTILFAARIDEHNATYNFDTGSFDVLTQELYFDGCGEYRMTVDGSCQRLQGTFFAGDGYSGVNMLPVRLNQPLAIPVPKSKAREVDAIMRDFHNVSVFVIADVESAGIEKTLTADGAMSARMSGDYERMAAIIKEMNMPSMVAQEPILSLNVKKAILVDWLNNDVFVREYN